MGPRLFFGREWLDTFPLGLDDRDGAAVDVEQDVIDEAARRVWKVGAEIEVRGEDLLRDAVLADAVFPPPRRIRKEPPACAASKSWLSVIRAWASEGRAASRFGERIPHPAKTQALKILHVDRGKFLHALMQQTKRQPEIVDSPECKARFGGFFPDGIVHPPAFGGESDDAPARVPAITPDDPGRRRSGQRARLDGGIAQQPIHLRQHQLRQGNIAPGTQ